MVKEQRPPLAAEAAIAKVVERNEDFLRILARARAAESNADCIYQTTAALHLLDEFAVLLVGAISALRESDQSRH
ncbi:MAG: hypothetical protein OES26_25290 [Gammaproteobacteria bacterium]|nr:hypothetical protein [Gammaproteobacteria bacterium]